MCLLFAFLFSSVLLFSSLLCLLISLIPFLKKVLDELRKSTKKKVVAIMSAIGYIGVDVFVHHLINATGGRDANQTIQKLGRGLRKAEDKASVEYHDFLLRNNVTLEQHSVARIDTLKQEGHPISFEPPIVLPVEEEKKEVMEMKRRGKKDEKMSVAF